MFLTYIEKLKHLPRDVKLQNYTSKNVEKCKVTAKLLLFVYYKPLKHLSAVFGCKRQQ